MSFQTIPSIEPVQFYLDVAFGRAKRSSDRVRSTLNKIERIDKSRQIELARVATAKDVLVSRFSEIVEKFPSLNHLAPFYRELAKVTLDYDDVKQSLGALNWASKTISKLGNQHYAKIKTAQTIGKMNEYRKGFYGRISSVLKKISKNLKILENARRIITNYPVVKEIPTICLTGFPNVGKSTLLNKLTGSKAEIKSYAFTTKSLNLGYMTLDKEKIQLIDTPGTLARENRMNLIERQANIAMKHAGNIIVFVWDLTDTYPIKQQEKLFEQVKKFNKPIVEYLSKTDLLDKAVIEEFRNKRKVTTSKIELKKAISKKLKI